MTHPPLSETYFYDCSARGLSNIQHALDTWFDAGFEFQERHVGNKAQRLLTREFLWESPRVCPLASFGSFRLVDPNKFKGEPAALVYRFFSDLPPADDVDGKFAKLKPKEILDLLQQPQTYQEVSTLQAVDMVEAFMTHYQQGYSKRTLDAMLGENNKNLPHLYRRWVFDSIQYHNPQRVRGFVLLTDKEVFDLLDQAKAAKEAREAKPTTAPKSSKITEKIHSFVLEARKLFTNDQDRTSFMLLVGELRKLLRSLDVFASQRQVDHLFQKKSTKGKKTLPDKEQKIMEKLQKAIAAYRARTSNADLLELLDDAQRRLHDWEEMSAKEREVMEQYVTGFGPILDIMEGAVKASAPTQPKPTPAPEDKPKQFQAPKPVPAPEDKTKPAPKPAPKVKTASQELEELAELVGGSEKAEMMRTARAMREVEEIVRLASEVRALGLGSFANTMDDLAALMG